MTQIAPEAPTKIEYFLYNPDGERNSTDWRIHKGQVPPARMVRLELDQDESAALDADIAERGERAVAVDVLRRIAQVGTVER
jgi:hypothetical protein